MNADALTVGSDFDGAVYQEEFDFTRLTGQIRRVHDCMIDGAWRTLREIATVTGDPESSISAQLRNLRKRKFGSFVVDVRARGDRSHGLFEYQLQPQNSARSNQHG